jgi:phosphoesterase RecJ-like protein
MKPPTEIINQICGVLRDKKNILVTTHIFPDGDALGSQLALGDILESLGKRVFYFSEDGCSHLHDFIPNCWKLEAHLPDTETFDAAIALDCGDRQRLGREMEQLLRIKPFIVIDHHAGHKNFGDLNWVDARRSSTGEMVYELAMALGARISYEAAFALYAAIVSDTGSFKYAGTTANTFHVAGELVALGVKPAEVAGKIFDNYTANRLRLLQAVLATLELHAENRIGLISATRSKFAETGTTKEDTEDFINYPRALISVQVAVFIKEAKDDWISVSLRSKGKRDVAAIARTFGGGGHRNAAGFRLRGTNITEIRGKLLPQIEKILT